ncbi:hypothetical protein C8F04DRAFT_13783 [Mycena alexandri]|uniref:F-box domain-containing protein n=1 Tax=Mycena alexandri TaxID=1745969 RepID=A0AAD6XF07_9AGAR|nr:hypothetical protein C8F04DRAFT_13783 [Mycena alexandri]
MPPSLLPVEILESVFRFLSQPALAVVARSGPAVYPVALRVLYRDLSVSNSPHDAPPSVVRTLAKRPDIARHVRCFALALDQSESLFHSFLATALSAMPALVSLDIFTDAASWVLPDTLVYTQLQHFACSFPFDSRVAAFLNNAPALESVQVESTSLESPLVAASLPRLAEFTGCSSAAAVVVPGRPVESIHINSGELTEDLVPALAKSTAMVTVLSITTSSSPMPLLQTLGQHLPHIMYLRITSTCNLPAPPTTIFYQQVAEALAFFPNLQSFELSGMYWPSSKQPHNPQRVWQSQPFTTESAPQDEVVDLYSNTADFFFS